MLMDPEDYPRDGLERLHDAVDNEPVDPLPGMSAEFYARGGRGMYDHRVRTGYPRNLTVLPATWDELTQREQDRYINEFRAGLTAALAGDHR